MGFQFYLYYRRLVNRGTITFYLAVAQTLTMFVRKCNFVLNQNLEITLALQPRRELMRQQCGTGFKNNSNSTPK